MVKVLGWIAEFGWDIAIDVIVYEEAKEYLRKVIDQKGIALWVNTMH